MKFSIAIPAFKRKFFRETIESCLSQTYQDYEVVIVNDASPEDLENVVKEFSDSRIRYYCNEKNCGAIDVVDNWNKCLSYCTGEYIICMGDDDKLLPCCLEEYVKLIAEYPGLGVYHGLTEIIDDKSNFYKVTEARPKFEGVYSFIYHRWAGGRHQYIGDFLFDIALLRKEGGFHKLPLAWASDDISAVKAAAFRGIANTQTVVFQYRINPYAISITGDINQKLSATLAEEKWYVDAFKTIPPLDKQDSSYYQTLKDHVFSFHFKEKKKHLLYQQLQSSKWGCSFSWWRHRKKIGLSSKDIIKQAIKAGKF